MKLNRYLYIALVTSAISLPISVFALATDDATSKPPEKANEPVITSSSGAYLSSQFARGSGDLESSVQYLQRVHKTHPDDLDITRQLQGMLLLQGQIDDAASLAKDLRKTIGNDPLSTLLVSLQAIKSGDYKQASDILEADSEASAGQLWQPLMLAWLDIERKQLNKPLRIEKLEVNTSRTTPLVNYHLALINNQAGFKKEATENFKNAIEDPKRPPVRVMRALLSFYTDNKQPKALKPIVDAYLALHADDEDAKPLPLAANVKDGVGEILYTMGGIMLGAGINNEAAIYLQLALYINPDFPEVAQGLGDSYAELRQYDRSNQYYGQIKPDDKRYKNAQLRVAVNYERMDKLDDAIASLDKLSAAYPNEADALVTKGDLLRIHSKYADAIQAYTQAVSRLGNLKPNHWMVLFARGACYEREGNWALAEVDLRKSLELNPNQPDVLNYLGFGLLERGQNPTEASGMIEKALRARPDDGQILDSMGWALYLQGKYDDAEEYVERAVEIMPSDPTVNDHLGDVYWRVGRKNEARFQWERSLTFSPEDKLADSIRRKLKDGLPPTSTTTSDNGRSASAASIAAR